MSSFDFEELEVELDLDTPDTTRSTEGLPLTPVRSMPRMPATSFNVREALELIDEPHELFDFSDTNLSPTQQMYIISYAVRGTRAGASRLAGVPYKVVDEWMKDEEFRVALQNAVDIARDSLEEELLRRAMNGSDRLLLEAVRAAKPERYQKKTTSEHKITGEVVHSWAELAREASKVIEIEGGTVDEDVE